MKFLGSLIRQQVTILRMLILLLLAMPTVGQVPDSSSILRKQLLRSILKNDTLIVEGENDVKAYNTRAFIRHRYQEKTAKVYIITKYFSDSSLMSNSKEIFAFGGALYTASSLVSEEFVKKVLADNVGFTPKYVEKYTKRITGIAKSRLVKRTGAFFMGFGFVAFVANAWGGIEEIQKNRDEETSFPKIPSFGNAEYLLMILDLREEPFVQSKITLLALIDHSLSSNISEDDLDANVNRIDSILSSDKHRIKTRVLQRSKWIASNIDTLPLPTLPKYVLKEPKSSTTNGIPLLLFALVGGVAFFLAYFVLFRKGVLK